MSDVKTRKIRKDPVLNSKIRHLALRSSLHASSYDSYCPFLALVAVNCEPEAAAQGAIKNHVVDEEDVRLLLQDYARWLSLEHSFGLALAQAFVPWIKDTLIWYKKPDIHTYVFLAEVDGLWRMLSRGWLTGPEDISQLVLQVHYESFVSRTFEFIP